MAAPPKTTDILARYSSKSLVSVGGLVNGDPITTLVDYGGAGNDGVQATGTKQATLVTNVYNGHPVIRFDGVDDEYRDTTFTGLAGAAGMTIVVSVIMANGVTERRLSQRASQFDFRFRTDITNDEITFGLQTSGGYTVRRTAAAMTYGVPQRVVLVYDGANMVIRREGVQEDSFAKTGLIANGSGDHIIAGTSAIDVLELVIYSVALSGAEITAAEAWLAAEYAAGATENAIGASAGTSTVTGTLSATVPIVGASAGTSTVSGATSATVPIVGASAGTSTVTGAVRATVVLVASSAGTSTVTGAITVAAGVAGSSAGTSTVTGAISATVPIIGSSAGTSSVVGAVRATVTITAAAAGTSTVAGAASATVPIVGSSAGTSSVSGALSGQGQEAAVGSSSGTSTVTGSLSATVLIAGSSAGVSTVAGTVSASVAALGASGGTSSVSGATTVAGGLAGASNGTSSLVAALQAFVVLVSASAGTSSVTGALTGGLDVLPAVRASASDIAYGSATASDRVLVGATASDREG